MPRTAHSPAHEARELTRRVADQSVYCRTIQRADGRDVHLYGYAPHTLPVQAQPELDLPQGGELRWHPLRREWNIYAAHRQSRTFKPSAADNPLAPSLPGKPVTEIPVADFELAVFDNKFTSLHPQATVLSSVAGTDKRPARGQCEVIVYGPESEGNLHTIGQAQRRLLLAAWADRYEALFRRDCDFVLPFENRGDDVGVTLHHPHGQIYGFAETPVMPGRAVEAFASGYSLEREIENLPEELNVEARGDVLAWCPPYARYPYEVWVAPRTQRDGVWSLSERESDQFAELVGAITDRYDRFFGQPTPYMFALHCAPASCDGPYHMTAQFYPILRAPGRLKYLASIEQHTGVFTVDVLPEQAATALRTLEA